MDKPVVSPKIGESNLEVESSDKQADSSDNRPSELTASVVDYSIQQDAPGNVKNTDLSQEPCDVSKEPVNESCSTQHVGVEAESTVEKLEQVTQSGDISAEGIDKRKLDLSNETQATPCDTQMEMDTQSAEILNKDKAVESMEISDTTLIAKEQLDAVSVAIGVAFSQSSAESGPQSVDVHNQDENRIHVSETPTVVTELAVAENEVPAATDSAPIVSLENVREITRDNAPVPIQLQELPNPAPNTSETIAGGTVSQDKDASAKTGLNMLSVYDSDSDSDEVSEVPATQAYQNRFVEIDSDSSSDCEVLSGTRSPIDLEILGAGHGEDDEEENLCNAKSPRVKGEMHLDDLPPIQDLHITVPEEECTELGHVQSIVEQLVLVNSLPGTVPLDLDTILFLDKGNKVLGEIFDVLGQVSDPLYCVRFNSNKEIKQKGITVGQTVYVAPRTEHTQFVVLANLMKVRGSDASWENDVEPPERHLAYSDDEEESAARSARAMRNRNNRAMDSDDDGPKRQRPGETPFPAAGYPYHSPRGRNFYRPPNRQPHYPPPSHYNIAGNSWHSNYYQNYAPPQQHNPQYRMGVPPPAGYGGPPRNMPPQNAPPYPGLVLNPYAVNPPPHLMQQPIFPPPLQQPPPPPPPQRDF